MTIGTEKTSGMKINLRQWGQGGLQDGEFETTGTGRTSGWGV